MRYLETCTLEELKRASKKLKEELKNTRNGKQRKFFLSKEYVPGEKVFDFLTEEANSTLNKIKEVREQAWLFINDEKEIEKAGWYTKKPNEAKLLEWADKAYPNIKIDMFDVLFEQEVVENEFKMRG
jgi:hypothetical protein